MPAIAIKPAIYWIGVNDRTTDLFEGLWPITEAGVSYNSYVVKDEKTALIDLVRAAQVGPFLEQLYDVVDPAKLDYVVINHVEPDHTGAIRILQNIAPQAVFLCSPKAKGMLASYYGLTQNVQVVNDGETITLGAKSLQFHMVPFVHWPETMVTYEPTEKVLFSCDAFGGYGALRGAIFDDDCTHMDFYIQESLRYYVNIVARFSGPTLKAIAKLQGVPLDVIAPSHGLVWRKNPGQIVELYRQWAELATQPGDPGVTLIYGSMYGNTEAMMNAVAEGVSKTGLPLEIFDAARVHASFVLPHVWTKRGVIVGAPTYEVSLFPPVALMMEMIAHKRILNKQAAYFGSYGWSGGALKDLQRITEGCKWEWVETLEVLGGPTNQDLHAAEAFGERFARAVAAG
ncbi:MAG: FprA family A-type flavoprotein [Chloroflexota bacterium]